MKEKDILETECKDLQSHSEELQKERDDLNLQVSQQQKLCPSILFHYFPVFLTLCFQYIYFAYIFQTSWLILNIAVLIFILNYSLSVG